MTAVVFLDTETTGLNPLSDHVWEVAALRVEPGQPDEELHMLVDHAPPGDEYLASRFADDYKARYDPELGLMRHVAVHRIRSIFRGRAHMVGAVPSFDAERIGVMRRLSGIDEPDPWHYHLIDVEILAVGYLRAKRKFGAYRPGQIEEALALPYDSNLVSRAVGVEPDEFDRHTAMGDVLWAKAIYDAVIGA